MNSSTSSSRTELKVVAVVLVVLACVELVIRRAESKLSIDLEHIRSGEEISARLGESTGKSILLLGNSLTRNGVDRELLRAGLGDGDVTVEVYHPDGSSVNEWAYAFRRYFAEPGNVPDLMIIGAGRSHLFDANLRPDGFGAYYCSNADIPRYFGRHVRTPDHAAGFFIARFSAAYSSRHRIQPRFFAAMKVPHYYEVLDELAAKPRAVAENPEHQNLIELIEHAHKAGTRVVVLAIPMIEPYPLPSATAQVIADSGATLVDARELKGIDRERFHDGYHLDGKGANILTEHLVDVLRPMWDAVAEP